MTESWQHCPPCGGEQRFEQPPCDDQHGLDCPDLACVECGHAIMLAGFPSLEVALRLGVVEAAAA